MLLPYNMQTTDIIFIYIFIVQYASVSGPSTDGRRLQFQWLPGHSAIATVYVQKAVSVSSETALCY
jgi:hypothetical protein